MTTPGAPDPSQGQIKAIADLTAVIDKLNKSLEGYGGALRNVNDRIGTQIDLQQEITKQAQDQRSENEKARAEEEARERLAERRLRNMLKEVEQISDLSGAVSVAKKAWRQFAEENKKVAKAAAIAGSALQGMKAGLSFANAGLGALLSVGGSVIGMLTDIAASIISIPFKLFDYLFKKAKQAMSGGTELAQAYENVRKVFGDLSTSVGKSVKSLGIELSKGMITPTLSAVRVFGNLAEATNYANEIASETPHAYQQIMGQLSGRSGVEVLAMAKGLGMATEDVSAYMRKSIAEGRGMEEMMTEVTKYAKGMASAFNLDSKMISRDMAKAAKDVKHFANVSDKELAEAAVYAHKLGLSLEEITGTLDAFNTFDEAAENVSKLSEAFGVNIDTMKLLEADTSAEQLDIIKSAFSAAGKSADQMNRAELQLIASTTNMDEATVKQALSMKNAGVSMTQVKAVSGGLEKQTMDTNTALLALSKDIEKMVKAAEPPKGDNFLDVFIEGFVEGIERSSDFRRMIMEMAKAIMVVRQAGRELGQAFVNYFPGVKQMINSLADILGSNKLGGMFKSFTATFTEFFKTLKSGTASVSDLMDKLGENFSDYLSKSGPSGKSFLDGLRKFWDAVRLIIAGAIDWVGEQLVSLAESLASGVSDQAGSLMGAVSDEISPITDAFSRFFEKLKEPMSKLADKFFGWLGDKIGQAFSDNWGKVALFYLAPAIVSGFVRAFSAATGMLILEAAVKPFLASFIARSAPIISNATNGITSIIAGAPRPGGGPPPPSPGFLSKLSSSMQSVGVFVVTGIAAIGLIIGAMRLLDVKEEEIPVIITLVGSLATLMIASSASTFAMSRIKVPDNKTILPAIKSLGLVVAGMLGAAGAMLFMLKTIEISAGQAAAAAPIIIAVGAMFLEATGITAAIYAVQKIRAVSGNSATRGFVILGGVVTAMMLSAGGMIAALSGFDVPADVLAAAGPLLMAVAEMFKVAAITVPIAIGAGLAITGTFGIGAAELGVGLAAIAVVVGEMIYVINDLVSYINKLDVKDADLFKNKAMGMAELMKALSNMIEVISSSQNIDISIFDDADDVIRELTGYVGAIKDAVIGLTGQLMSIVERIKNQDLYKAAESFSGIISAIAAIASAIKPDAMAEIVDSDFWTMGDPMFMNRTLGMMVEYSNQLLAALWGRGGSNTGLVAVIDKFVVISSKIPKGGEAAFAAVGTLIKSIPALLKSIQLPREAFDAYSKATSAASLGGGGLSLGGGGGKDLFEGIVSYAKGMSESIGKLVAGISGVLPTILNSFGSLKGFTEADAKSLETVGPLLQIVVDAIMSIATTVAKEVAGKPLIEKLSDAVKSIKKGADTTQAFDKFTPAIEQIVKGLTPLFDAVGSMLPNLFNKLSMAVKLMPRLTGDEQNNITTIKNAMESVASIVSSITGVSGQFTVSDEPSNGGGGFLGFGGGDKPPEKSELERRKDKFVNEINTAAAFLEVMTAPIQSKTGSSVSPIDRLKLALDKIATSKFAELDKSALSNLKKMGSTTKVFSEVMSSISSIAQQSGNLKEIGTNSVFHRSKEQMRSDAMMSGPAGTAFDEHEFEKQFAQEAVIRSIEVMLASMYLIASGVNRYFSSSGAQGMSTADFSTELTNASANLQSTNAGMSAFSNSLKTFFDKYTAIGGSIKGLGEGLTTDAVSSNLNVVKTAIDGINSAITGVKASIAEGNPEIQAAVDLLTQYNASLKNLDLGVKTATASFKGATNRTAKASTTTPYNVEVKGGVNVRLEIQVNMSASDLANGLIKAPTNAIHIEIDQAVNGKAESRSLGTVVPR